MNTTAEDIRAFYESDGQKYPDWFEALRRRSPPHFNFQRPRESWAEICDSYVDLLPDKTVLGADGSVYLKCYHIAGLPRSERDRRSHRIHDLYLQHIYRGDEDQELHNHPWAWAFSLILRGGYEEERRHTGVTRVPMLDSLQETHRVRRYVYLPGDVVEINADTYHRLDLPLGEAWTLLFVGEQVQSWEFWDRETGKRTPYRTFLRTKGLED